MRPQVVLMIEEFISRLNPHPDECRELLDAITASLKSRFCEDDLADALHEFWRLNRALEDLEGSQPTSEEDEAVDTYKALTETH
jgi:hypothetical protein